MSFTPAWVGKLQLKWLSFSGAVLIELSASETLTSMADRIARELWPLLLEGLDHPFKACREEIARCCYDRGTFFLFVALYAADVANVSRVSFRTSLQQTIMTPHEPKRGLPYHALSIPAV